MAHRTSDHSQTPQADVFSQAVDRMFNAMERQHVAEAPRNHSAYVNRFEYLARFYAHNMSEEWRCRRFERGLRHELMKMIVPLEIKEFPALVEKAKMIELLESDPSRVMRAPKSSLFKKQQEKKPYVRSTQPKPEPML
ncbi:uncharacterized protein HKW66_Vig0148640 [Vigna angularis]|uniref:Uncharacterized protein n=1 Tax=Phaseolus angularis TaxID=3914 RepID=A0A8T0JUL5_PHAAN|nr:uncharacterized protein HKW66_Vig0148640 [Vigna angularis]